ncbi:hypothetical protein MKW92_001102 [Papaver armeniacum]|nr:hypothetical protein MKW92_001102 [Papaver armeniacum]
MSLNIFLLWLVSIPVIKIHAGPAPRGFLLNCGASETTKVGNLDWITDEGFIQVGNKTTLDNPDLAPILATLRFFPDSAAKKYCFVIPTIKGGKYLIRTTYYYGGYDGGKEPPVFDQIIEGSKWSTVNTTEDYAMGLSSYYEIIAASLGKTLSICLARNEHTTSNPFISALELEYLENSMYNSTDFNNHGLITVARHSFGYNGDLISFPDDQFNRNWQPFEDANPVVESHSNITSTDFWNLPPSAVFTTGLTTSRGKTLNIQWPNVSLPSANYYIALYFQDNRTPSWYSWRVFNVLVNGQNFYTNLNVTATGVTVYATSWALSGLTQITLAPSNDSMVGPVISAGEVFQIIHLGGRTLARDTSVMEDIARSFNNPPPDWKGDPCLPPEHAWTGVTCSTDKVVRVSNINLTNFGLVGTLSPSIANLTALKTLSLSGNKLSGSIPDMGTLKELGSLHLDNNAFEGSIPQSLGKLPKLQEIFLQNNNLKGSIPDAMKQKTGVNIQVTPGNHLTNSA